MTIVCTICKYERLKKVKVIASNVSVVAVMCKMFL